MEIDFDQLDRLLHLLRSHGVKSYVNPCFITVEFDDNARLKSPISDTALEPEPNNTRTEVDDDETLFYSSGK